MDSPLAIKHPMVVAWLAGAGLAELSPAFTEHGYDEVPLLAQPVDDARLREKPKPAEVVRAPVLAAEHRGMVHRARVEPEEHAAAVDAAERHADRALD